MKNLVLLLLVVISFGGNAQEQKVEIVHDSLFVTNKKPTSEKKIVFRCSVKGVVIEQTPIGYFSSIKLYGFTSKNENWVDLNSLYNSIQAKVPGVSISTNSSLGSAPKISMRGDDNTLVIVDGVRYDTSILNTLNVSDIESVVVAPSSAAATYIQKN